MLQNEVLQGLCADVERITRLSLAGDLSTLLLGKINNKDRGPRARKDSTMPISIGERSFIRGNACGAIDAPVYAHLDRFHAPPEFVQK